MRLEATPLLCLPLPPTLRCCAGDSGSQSHPGGDWEAGTLGDGCRVSIARRSLSSSALSLASSLSSKTWGEDYGERLGQWGGGVWRAQWGSTDQRSDVRNLVGSRTKQSTLCLGKGQAQGTGPGQAPCLWACPELCLRVSGPPFHSFSLALSSVQLTHPYSQDSTLVLPDSAFCPVTLLLESP